MRIISILAAFAAIALPVAAASAAEEPQPVHAVSTAEPVRIGNDSYVIRMSEKALQTPVGRARLLQSLEQSARRLCADVQPRSEAPACERGVVTLAELRTPSEVGRAIRLALTEQQGPVLASIR